MPNVGVVVAILQRSLEGKKCGLNRVFLLLIDSSVNKGWE